MNIGAIAVVVSTVVLMVYSGMMFDPALVRRQFERRNLQDFGKLAVVNYIVIPLLTLGIIRFFSFPPVIDLVLLTMALLPCASVVPALVSISGEPAERSLFILIIMSLLNIAAVPILLALLALPWVVGPVAEPAGGAAVALVKYLVSVFGPMGLGAGLRILSPKHGLIWQERLRRILPGTMLVTFFIFVYSYRELLLDLGWRDLGALLVFETVCIAAGLALARSTPGNRIATILICGLRNVVMGLSFTVIVYPQTDAVAYMMTFTNIMFFAVAVWFSMRKMCSAATAKSGVGR